MSESAPGVRSAQEPSKQPTDESPQMAGGIGDREATHVPNAKRANAVSGTSGLASDPLTKWLSEIGCSGDAGAMRNAGYENPLDYGNVSDDEIAELTRQLRAGGVALGHVGRITRAILATRAPKAAPSTGLRKRTTAGPNAKDTAAKASETSTQRPVIGRALSRTAMEEPVMKKILKQETKVAVKARSKKP